MRPRRDATSEKETSVNSTFASGDKPDGKHVTRHGTRKPTVCTHAAAVMPMQQRNPMPNTTVMKTIESNTHLDEDTGR